MLKRFVPLLAPGLLSLVAATPAPPSPAPTPAPAQGHAYVAITTAAGTITLDLEAARAPLTTANFLKYVDARRFDGTVFYRSMHLDWGTPPNGLIQGGTQNDPKRIFKPIAHEPTSQTGVLHKRGTISMARFAPGTANGDFSILVSDQPGLDAKPDAPDADSKAGFAAFGHVVSGMEIVERIWGLPRSATKGAGVMRGQMLDPAVKIVSMRRVPAPIVVSDPALPSSAEAPSPAAD